jgi:hypothetical protein
MGGLGELETEYGLQNIVRHVASDPNSVDVGELLQYEGGRIDQGIYLGEHDGCTGDGQFDEERCAELVDELAGLGTPSQYSSDVACPLPQNRTEETRDFLRSNRIGECSVKNAGHEEELFLNESMRRCFDDADLLADEDEEM